ncbi:MAG: cob(I)yrinic acid a,c-diamide adenosyltransferase [Parcubacteria group bacterium]|nr:cob(I)yrinic acid a,c-diamide adenosyltransferase [Parcubacteria group bacterium]
MIVVFTGNGKGKTTAALGQAMRALGRGRRVLMIQFIKGPWKSGEDFFAAKFKISNFRFRIRKMGLGFVGILGDKLPRLAHVAAAEKALNYFKRELKSGKWDMIILDEINVAARLKLVKSGDVLRTLKKVPPAKIVLLTGRYAPAAFIRRADLVTEMREIKHPFKKGKLAEAALEF